MSPSPATLVLYTTRYRLGGREMALAAAQMAGEQLARSPGREVRAVAVESKAEFLAAVRSVTEPLGELHFIGHSGLYGPMFGTTARPDQMSRAEWSALDIPFAQGASAHFHSCRSARWFAPFFARRYGVPTYGHLSYTTFSHRPDVYEAVAPDTDRHDVYVVSTPGLKGMGVLGALRKRLGPCPTLPMTRFEPAEPDGDASYDGVAELYDAVFEDFRVREDEWRWVNRQLPAGARVLDVGCGNGSLLRALGPRVGEGIGVDASARMIELARRHSGCEQNLRFETISGPALPVPDASVDVVLSMLSWRYLDWDPMVEEIRRVLRPGGTLLIVDMAVSPYRWPALGRVLADKVRETLHGFGHPEFKRALRRMVENRSWSEMLRHNPMRAEHEYRWYLPSRFTGGTFQTLNRSLRSEILAFRWDRPE